MGLSRLYDDLITGEQFSIRGARNHSMAFRQAAYPLIEALGGELPFLGLVLTMDEGDYLDMLSDMLSEWAPEGYYFGENPHDDGVFGFWPVPENFWEVR